MLALRPEVADFIDIMGNHDRQLELQTVDLTEGSNLIGSKVSDLRASIQASVLAVTRRDGSMLANPAGMEVLEEGDHLIVLGTREQMRSLAQYCERCKLG
jgi:voltage-gated potassium channel